MKDDQKPVTKKEFREGLDELAQIVNASFEQVATKEDIKNFVTKDDIKKELKRELAKYATKEDLKEVLKPYATKEDLKQFATKQDIQNANNELFDRLDNSTYSRLNNHEVRIAKLEVRHR